MTTFTYHDFVRQLFTAEIEMAKLSNELIEKYRKLGYDVRVFEDTIVVVEKSLTPPTEGV